MHRIAVLGAGNWGTALALLLARKGCDVSLWVYDPGQADVILSTRQNPFLQGYPLPEDILVTTSIPEALADRDAVVFAVRSEGAASVARQLQSCLPLGVPVISATKGLDAETGCTMSQMLRGIIGSRNPIVALSGPNIAAEIVRGLPSATVVASEDEGTAHAVQLLLMSSSLRVYTNSDIVGVELAGALKNIIAIAAGISDGLGFGDNSKAALLTRGLAEITRLGVKMGARESTFLGLAGVGDLIVTCASPLSRNHRVGIGLGKGRALEDVLEDIGQVAEGVPTTRVAFRLAARYDTPMPITEQVYQVLFLGKPPSQAVADLMAREPKDEIWSFEAERFSAGLARNENQ